MAKKRNKGSPQADILWRRNNSGTKNGSGSGTNSKRKKKTDSDGSGSGSNSTRKKKTRKTDEDERYKAAAETSVYHNLEIPKSMRAEKFSIPDSENPTLQQRVRRLAHEIRLSLIPKPAAGTPATSKTSTTAAKVPSHIVNKRRRSLSPLTNSTRSKTASSTEDQTNKAKKATATPTTLPTTALCSDSSDSYDWDVRNIPTPPPKNSQPKLKKSRRNSKQAQVNRQNKKILENTKKAAVKEGTKMLYAERQKDSKDKSKKSARVVAEIQSKKFGIVVAPTYLSDLVRKGQVGTSPKKRGPNKANNLPNDIFKLLAEAFETYQQINQINGEAFLNKRQYMIQKVNPIVGPQYIAASSDRLYRQLQQETALSFNAKVECNAEERRVRWTSYHNLKLWFGTWKKQLTDLGFGEEDAEGKFYIPPSNLRRILNLDETGIVLDGSDGKSGGRPSVTFVDPSLPDVGKPSGKTNISTTMICGSTAWGEPLPPHFQFNTRAQTDEMQKVRLDTALYLKFVKGAFGNRSKDYTLVEKQWDATFGVNEKGGMDQDEFQKYISNNIMKLYPDARDEKGKRVIVKVDSGPGRYNPDMLAEMRANGFYLFPCVPNSTAVTQETDISYGLFKSKVRKNLEMLAEDRKEAGIAITVAPWMIGLLVFGGVDPESKKRQLDDAFAIAFSNEKNRDAWMKVGAAPFTMECLKSEKVRHDMAADDPLAAKLGEIEGKNHLACDILSLRGFKADSLKKNIKKTVAPEVSVTVPQSKERIEALSKVTRAGPRFLLTGGEHLCTDDCFKAAELQERKKKEKVLEKEKKERKMSEKIESAALAILESGKAIEKLLGKELQILLAFYKVPSKRRTGKPVSELRAMYGKLKEENAKPLQYKKWTEADEERLMALRDNNVEMKDTALGRYNEKRKEEAKEETKKALDKMDPMERVELFKEYGHEDGGETVREVTQIESV